MSTNSKRVSYELLSSQLQNTIDMKSELGHTHTESDVVNLDKYTKGEVNNLLNSKLDKTGTLDWDKITNKPNLADNSWKSPVATSTDLPVSNNEDGDLRLILDSDEVYTWDVGENKWKLIGANDTHITWEHLQEKPTTFIPSPHTHIENDITNLDKYTKLEVDTKLTTKSNTNHTHAYSPDTHHHDIVYSKLTHNHDNTYYTETEVNTLLGSKANNSHTHLKSHITDFAVSWTEVLGKPTNFTPSTHSHTESQITDLQSYSLNTHNHDGRYYTESEVNTLLGSKEDNFANHSLLVKLTESVVNANYDLNMLYDHENRLDGIELGHNHDDLYATKTHNHDIIYSKLVHTHAYSPDTHNHDLVYSKLSHTHDYSLSTHHHDTVYSKLTHDHIGTYSEISHHHDENYSDIAHNHDGRYFTESEITTKLLGKSDTSHTHDERYYTETEINTLLATKSDTHTHPYAPTIHTHTIANVTGLQTALDDKSAIHSHPYASTSHNHPVIDVTGLQTALDGKSDNHTHPYSSNIHNHDSVYSILAHTHADYVTHDSLGDAGYGDMVKAQYDTNGDGVVDVAEMANSVVWENVSGKPLTFIPATHTHTVANITDLTLSWTAITNKPTTFTPTSHTHEMSEITGLSLDWDVITGKPTTFTPSTHTHAYASDTHNHDVVYSKLDHVHSYASDTHNHSGIYEPVFTKNTAFNKNFGTTAGTVVEGNDTRLSDSRTPTAHTHDDRYFTEGEITTLLSAKSDTHTHPYANSTHTHPYANSTHTHTKANITDFPASLPANGGNSDTVDSLHASDFARAYGRVVTNLNDYATKESGFYGISGVATNSPEGSYQALINVRNSDTGLQLLGGYSTNNLWYRGWASTGGTFYPWRKIWHDGNDGTGSTLDADLLDGIHASSFVQTSDARLTNSRQCNNSFDNVTTARTNLGLTGTSNTTHYHDGRYFTETEINTKLASKVNGTMKITVSTSAPTSPATGDIWFDTSA